MIYFENNGRRIPTSLDRVFSPNPSYYYKLVRREINFLDIYNNFLFIYGADLILSPDEFESRATALLRKIQSDDNFNYLLNGIHVPFILPKKTNNVDIGYELENILLPSIKSSFNHKYPECHFKAILQSDTKLLGNISLDPNSRHDRLIDKIKSECTIGWYFPQVLQEFDIDSQRRQMIDLPDPTGFEFCLSGGHDIAASIIGQPDLLINPNDYSPILCLSAYVHSDDRLALIVKSYGPHLEFWCMTQMLTPKIKQVSEQWSGGLSLFEC